MAAVEHDPAPEERAVSARPGRVFAIIAGALILAVLLNAPELENEAKQKPYGRERDTWVAIWKPFAAISRALYLDKPREWADDALGRTSGGGIFQLPVASDGTAAPGSTVAPPATSTGTATAKQATATATPTVPAQIIRTPSVAAPLRLWVGGDSMSKILGEAVVRQGTESGLFTVTQESQLSSGLTRPDFFDWPGEFNQLSHAVEPFEVFIVMFGANDAQGIVEPNGTIHQDAGTPEWNAEYRRRVAGVMDLLKGNDRLVVWVGQPIMRSETLSEKMKILNGIYEEEAAKRPWVEYFPLWPLFVDANGGYNAYIVDDDGETKLMRNPDGVHLVRDGGERAARAILQMVKEEAKVP